MSEGGSAGTAGLDVGLLRQAAKHVSGHALKDGSWFKSLVAEHVKKHQASVTAATWDQAYPGLDAPARAARHIKTVAWKASAAGAISALGASSGEILSLLTEGLGAPIGVPAAMLSMGLEAAYTTLLQVDLACDLASIYGVPFQADDAGEVATLFAVALGVEERVREKRAGADRPPARESIEERLIDLEEGEIGTRIGRKLLEDSIMKNIVPFAGIAIAARWNFVGTHALGAKVNRYIRYRHALLRAYETLDCSNVADPMLLIEGAWILATSDGDPTHEELLAIGMLAEVLGKDARLDTTTAQTEDEDAWLERLGKIAPDHHGAILETLFLVAATDRELQTGERRILRRIGKAIGREIDFARIEQICRHLADGEEFPTRVAS